MSSGVSLLFLAAQGGQQVSMLSDFRISIVRSPLLRPQVVDIDYDAHNATFNSSSFKFCEETKESGAEILVEQGETLGNEC